MDRESDGTHQAVGARLAALLSASAVSATVVAFLVARRARRSAINFAAVTANQRTTALFLAGHVEPAVEACAAVAFARMLTGQDNSARLRTLLQQFRFPGFRHRCEPEE